MQTNLLQENFVSLARQSLFGFQDYQGIWISRNIKKSLKKYTIQVMQRMNKDQANLLLQWHIISHLICLQGNIHSVSVSLQSINV